MQLKIELILQEVFDERISKGADYPKDKPEMLNLIFQDGDYVIAKLD